MPNRDLGDFALRMRHFAAASLKEVRQPLDSTVCFRQGCINVKNWLELTASTL